MLSPSKKLKWGGQSPKNCPNPVKSRLYSANANQCGMCRDGLSPSRWSGSPRGAG